MGTGGVPRDCTHGDAGPGTWSSSPAPDAVEDPSDHQVAQTNPPVEGRVSTLPRLRVPLREARKESESSERQGSTRQKGTFAPRSAHHRSFLTFRGSDRQVAQTNPPVRGRVSADRNQEAAQPLTTPRLVRKSSTDDSVRLHCMWGLGAFERLTSTFPDATEVPLHGLRKDGSRHVP